MKKTSLLVNFWLNVSLAIYMVLVGVDPVSILPFAVFSAVLGSMIWGKNRSKVAAIVIASLMALLNMTIESNIDVFTWIVSLILVLI